MLTFLNFSLELLLLILLLLIIKTMLSNMYWYMVSVSIPLVWKIILSFCTSTKFCMLSEIQEHVSLFYVVIHVSYKVKQCVLWPGAHQCSFGSEHQWDYGVFWINKIIIENEINLIVSPGTSLLTLFMKVSKKDVHVYHFKWGQQLNLNYSVQ